MDTIKDKFAVDHNTMLTLESIEAYREGYMDAMTHFAPDLDGNISVMVNGQNCFYINPDEYEALALKVLDRHAREHADRSDFGPGAYCDVLDGLEYKQKPSVYPWILYLLWWAMLGSMVLTFFRIIK
jgi:hypothetical protein